MREFCFEEPVSIEYRPDQVYVKQKEDRTEYTEGRKTEFGEEWEALKRTHQVIPKYIPQPVSAIWDEEDNLLQYTMEQYDFDARIEYALEDGIDEHEVKNAFEELEEVVSMMHEHPDLVPHGDLIGNTFTVNGSPVIIDPKGIPKSQSEENEWINEDNWQLDWLEENGLRNL